MTLQVIQQQYDADAGEMVEVSTELKRQHEALHKMADRATLAKALVYREIAERRTFLAAGCSSFREYIEDVRGESYRSGKMYLRVGRQFGGLLGGGDGAEGQPIALLSSPTDGGQDEGQSIALASDISSLGIFKLDGLAGLLEADDIEHIREAGEIRLPSGKTVSFEELREMSQVEAKRAFNAERKTIRDRVADLSEQLKLATSERDALRETSESADTRAADARAKEELYGPTARRVEDQRRQLGAARAHLDSFRQTLLRSGVTADSPAETRDHAREVVAYLRRTLRDMAAELADALGEDLGGYAGALAYTDDTDL